jgi:hypothetical protein
MEFPAESTFSEGDASATSLTVSDPTSDATSVQDPLQPELQQAPPHAEASTGATTCLLLHAEQPPSLAPPSIPEFTPPE